MTSQTRVVGIFIAAAILMVGLVWSLAINRWFPLVNAAIYAAIFFWITVTAD